MTTDLTEVLSTDWAAMRPPDILAELDEQDLKKVHAFGRVKGARKGALIFRQGDTHYGIFIIREGIIRTFFVSAGGREITLAYWQPGNYVGGPDMFGASINMWSGIATRDVEYLALKGADLKKLLMEIPVLAVNLINAQAHKGRWFSAVIQMLGTRSITERLAQLLLTLSDFYGRPEREGIVIADGFTHDDLARMIGASRQWVTMTLNRLQRSGVIFVGRRKIVVLRPQDLLRILSR